MNQTSLLLLTLAASAICPAHASTKPQPTINCAGFERTQDGNWKGKDQAVVQYEKSTFDFSRTVLRPGEVVIDGVDMKTRLDKQCTDKNQQK